MQVFHLSFVHVLFLIFSFGFGREDGILGILEMREVVVWEMAGVCISCHCIPIVIPARARGKGEGNHWYILFSWKEDNDMNMVLITIL